MRIYHNYYINGRCGRFAMGHGLITFGSVITSKWTRSFEVSFIRYIINTYNIAYHGMLMVVNYGDNNTTWHA